MRGQPAERPIAALMLRTMQKARYDAASLGHFGLAADGEGAGGPALPAADDHALEGLEAGAAALADPHVDLDGVPRLKVRDLGVGLQRDEFVRFHGSRSESFDGPLASIADGRQVAQARS